MAKIVFCLKRVSWAAKLSDGYQSLRGERDTCQHKPCASRCWLSWLLWVISQKAFKTCLLNTDKLPVWFLPGKPSSWLSRSIGLGSCHLWLHSCRTKGLRASESLRVPFQGHHGSHIDLVQTHRLFPDHRNSGQLTLISVVVNGLVSPPSSMPRFQYLSFQLTHSLLGFCGRLPLSLEVLFPAWK